jgi:hypothetical protein
MPLDSASRSTPLATPPRDVVADEAHDQTLRRIGAVLALTLLGVYGAWRSKKTTQVSNSRAQRIKFLTILRWVAVLPVALAVHETVLLTIMFFFPRIDTDFGIEITAEAVPTLGFILAGIYVAPSRRYETGTALTIIYVILTLGRLWFLPGTSMPFSAMSLGFCLLFWKASRNWLITQSTLPVTVVAPDK